MDQLILNRRRNQEGPITSWEDIKELMRKRFIPSHYFQDSHKRLSSLKQGSISVEEYHKEMEIAMMRVRVEEDPEATMTKFLNGLNYEIANMVELQPYHDIEELVQLIITVERQLKKKRSSSATNNPTGKIS